MANKKKKLTDVLEETTNQKYTPSNDIAPVRTSKSKIDTLIDNSAIGRIRNVWDDGYQFGDATRTILGVMNDNPIGNFNRNAVESGMDLTKSLFTGEGKFVKGNKATEKIKEIWDDGYQFGDIAESKNQITKTILGTTGDVAGRFIKGELQTAEGLVDTARYFSGDIYEKLGMKQFAEEEREKAKQNTTGFILGENDLYNNKKENGWSKKIDEYSLFGDRMDSIVESVGQQAFRIGLQQAVGSAGASEGTTKALNQLEIFAGSYGSAKSEALQNGADNKTATIRGIISGTSETISENLFDNIPGFKTGQIKGASTVKDIIGKSTEKVFGKEAGKLILRTFNAAGEGLEEIISNSLETASTDVVNYFMPEYTYGMEEGQGIEGNTFGEKAKKLFKDVFKSSKSDESKEAFITSFISTLITGGLTDGMTEVQKNQVIKAYAKDNNISVEQATKLFDGITELRMQEITDEATGYEDRINTENNLKQQLTQELRTNQNLNLQELQEGLIARDKFIKAVGTGVVTSKGLDLNESYKAYGGDVKYKNQIANIQKFMNNRNIDARFDATMFDNNEQNAIWTTENGKDSVIFNPKASADQIIQNIATHEMTHDIIAQKTQAGTNLFKDVLENIKAQKDYAKNRQEIEDLYAKYYDRNAEDFSAKVDEEMVANELGKNLGTQEYINRLVNEKPNLARRIYNWVVDKLDNIGKSDEYKEQKAYWKSVADKFEVAYNEQKTATGEDKTAYSVNRNLSQKYNISKELEQDFNKYIMPDIEETYKYENKETIKESLEELQQQRELYKDDNSDENFSKIFDINAKIRALEAGYNSLYDYYVGQEIERQLQKYNEYPDAVNNKIQKAKETEEKTNKLQKEIDEATPFKKAQFELTQKTNPMFDEYHVGIRSPKDILTWSEAIQRASEDGDGYAWGDFNEQDAQKALKDNKITIYSSYPIKNGVFVSTSYVQAQQYAGGEGNRVYSKTITPQRVAWISVDEGQYASVDVKPDTRYSISNKDSQGRTLSKEQQEYFKDTKIVDNEGNLLEVYRGEPTIGKTTYESRKGGGNKEINEYGIYFTNSKDFAKDFAFERISDPDDIFFVKKGKEGEVKSAYLNITNPLDLGNLTEQEIRDLYPYESSMAKQLYDEDKFVSDMLHFQEIGNHQLMKSYLDMKEIADNTDYDGLIAKLNVQGDELEYAVFNSNQIKSTDNLNPTENDDIRYSMQQEETPVTPGTRTTMGELFNENIAPIREDLSNITEQMNNLSNQIETLQNQLETSPQGYVETYNQQRNENIPTRNLTEEDANTLQDALMNDEGYLRSLDEEASIEKNDKLINKITNDIQVKLGLSKNQRNDLQDIIKDAVDNDLTTEEISDKLYSKFNQQEYTYTNEEAKEAKKLIRNTPLKVSDGIKTDIADYNAFKRSNFGKINFSRNGLPVDVAYAQLSEQNPAFFPSDIINPTEQLLKIADVANTMNEITETYQIMPDEFDDMADFIRDSIVNDTYENQMQSQYDLEKNIQFDMNGELVPTTVRTQESIDNFIENRDIAPVRQETQRQRNNLRERIDTLRRSLQEKFINRNYIIDEFSKASGNREIKYAGDNLNNVSSETQFNVNNKQTDINGKWIGKGVHEIFEPARKTGLYEAFNDYLIQKSNIERHNVGKGSQVPLVVSQQLVAQYENENPQFKEWAKDVYKYFDNVLQEQVDAGLITEDRYKDYRGEHGIYRSYVPFYEGELDINRYFDNEGNVRPVSTLKRSKGNATDVNQMLAVEDSMARQTYAYKRAIRQNELYREIVNSLDKYSDAMDIDVRNEPTNLDDSLYTTENGDKVLSAYVNGEKISAIISDELYNELSQDNENRIKQMEEDFSLITRPLQKVSDVRRKILTSWNPTFLARNAIKDIQDAAINSRHTKDMLANYFGIKKGQKAAIFELNDAKTETAQQFLALYGSDNLYGDYSRKGNWFTKANELIELAPRYAEFKATLQNGGTIQEAIYNAREVTTNFGRGGYITKALNRNGFTFLNANVQGLDKIVRNLSGENGVRGVTSVVAKGVAFAMLPSILNELLYGIGDDKDEEYEALPNYIKDNYYLIKLDNGKFLRIPKGRLNSVFGSLARRTINYFEGDENAYEGWGRNAWSQIGIGDLGSNNIFAPITQAFGSENGTAWYGGDIVPTRLQDKPAGEQTDASIDAVSNFIGENLGISPYKINYVLDQYTGGFGDVFLPMITPETTSGAETFVEHLVAPIKDSFVVNSTDDNKYAGEFYNTKDELEKKSNSQYATDEDKLRYKYMSNVSKQMSDLYKEKREVQADTTLGNKEKYRKVQLIQNEINSLAKEAMKEYDNFSNTENYTSIGEYEYYKDADGEWNKVTDDEAEFTAGLNDAEKTLYYNTKNKISGITKEYTAKTKELDKDSPLRKQYASERKENITRAITNSGLDNYSKAMIYSKYYSDKDTMTNVANAGYNVDTYINALYDIEEIRNKYSKNNGYTTEQRKAKTIAYINSLDMNIPQKAMLVRQYYSSYRDYNDDIVQYVNSLNIPYEDKVAILKGTGMTVNGNKVRWN